MKKIKSIKQLQSHKMRIKQEQLVIERKINETWNELKETVRPGNIARQAIGSIFRKKAGTQPQNKISGTAINFGLTLLAGKITEKLGRKLRSIFTRSKAKS